MKCAFILLLPFLLGCVSCANTVFISSANQPHLNVDRLSIGLWYTITVRDGREYGFELTGLESGLICGTMQHNIQGRVRKTDIRIPLDQIDKVESGFSPNSNIIFDSFQAEPPPIDSELFSSVLNDEFTVIRRDGQSFIFEKPVKVDRNFLYGFITRRLQNKGEKTEVKIPLPEIIRIEELFLL